MSRTENIALARRFYAPDQSTLAADSVWDISPGFPFGGVYSGREGVGEFYGKLMPLFESLGAIPDDFYGDDEDHVFVRGHYRGTAKDGGKQVEVRFIHLWTVRDGKLASLWQAADSHVVQQALGN